MKEQIVCPNCGGLGGWCQRCDCSGSIFWEEPTDSERREGEARLKKLTELWNLQHQGSEARVNIGKRHGQ